jgi:hypothetical protein
MRWGRHSLVPSGCLQPLRWSARVCVRRSSQGQFLPEIDAYWTLNPVMRVQTLVARTKDGDTFSSATVGSGVIFFVKPLSSRRRTNADEANRNLLTLGVIYSNINNVDKANENRLQFDAAPKFPLPKDMLMDDRNRLELRIIDGDVTWRYRNRLTFQRSFRSDLLGSRHMLELRRSMKSISVSGAN